MTGRSLSSVKRVRVIIYTDPGCPFGFNAQRQEAQLTWHYGDALEITRRMIVLAEKSSSFEERGLSREMVSANANRLRSLYGMPMLTEPREHLAATIDACRAYVGARMHDPEHANRLLRALRRRTFSDGQPLDDLEMLRAAAGDAGIRPEALEAWLTDDQVEAEVRADMADTRSPLPEALALPHRLSRSDGKLRYSTASAVFERDGRRVVMAGFQPFAVYEVAMANVAPDVPRRAAADGAEELLAWAQYPLATAEVAELRGIGLDTARTELERSGARFTPSAQDGYWSRG